MPALAAAAAAEGAITGVLVRDMTVATSTRGLGFKPAGFGLELGSAWGLMPAVALTADTGSADVATADVDADAAAAMMAAAEAMADWRRAGSHQPMLRTALARNCSAASPGSATDMTLVDHLGQEAEHGGRSGG